MAMGGIVVVDGRGLVGGNGINRLFLLTEEAQGVDCMKGWNGVCSSRDQAGMLENTAVSWMSRCNKKEVSRGLVPGFYAAGVGMMV